MLFALQPIIMQAQEPPAFVSRLYARPGEEDLWSNQPEAYVRAHYAGPRDEQVGCHDCFATRAIVCQ